MVWFAAILGTFQYSSEGYSSAIFCRIFWCGIDCLILMVGFQWEALTLLLIGISVNQLHTTPEGTTVLGVPIQMVAYVYTLIFVSELFTSSTLGIWRHSRVASNLFCSIVDLHKGWGCCIVVQFNAEGATAIEVSMSPVDIWLFHYVSSCATQCRIVLSGQSTCCIVFLYLQGCSLGCGRLI
jgi:hypothetical protein